MPLSDDPKVVALSKELLDVFDGLFGRHPGFRAAHAKGVLLRGTFHPSPHTASTLTCAAHLTSSTTTPLLVRFSNSTGVPAIPDADSNANPKGIAIRFTLPPSPPSNHRVHTDVIAHSTDGFPTPTGDSFLAFLRAIATSDMKAPSDPAHPKPIETFLHANPAALAFVTAPKPVPASFATEMYFGVTAYRFEDAGGKVRYGRYRVVPLAGVKYIAEGTQEVGPNFLMEEMVTRVGGKGGEGGVRFRLEVQVAEDGDAVNDSTVRWPAERPVVVLGEVEVTGLVEDEPGVAQQVIFDPIPRVKGIEASDDPLMELRAAIYLLSGRRRRADPSLSAATDKPVEH